MDDQIHIVKHSDNLDALFKALCAAQAELKHASKSAENPFFKSKYADLPEVLDTGRPVATANGLAISQFPTGTGLTTVIGHESGQYMMAHMSMKPADSKPQTLGSCLTYARRYAYAAVLGIAQDDDDGNDASGKVFNMNDKRAQEWAAKVLDRQGIDADLHGELCSLMHERPLSYINNALARLNKTKQGGTKNGSEKAAH